MIDKIITGQQHTCDKKEMMNALKMLIPSTYTSINFTFDKFVSVDTNFYKYWLFVLDNYVDM